MGWSERKGLYLGRVCVMVCVCVCVCVCGVWGLMQGSFL